jgi:hypothetical protein
VWWQRREGCTARLIACKNGGSNWEHFGAKNVSFFQNFEVDMSYVTMSFYYLDLDIVSGGVLDFSR